jgi:hypothetical protein
LETIEFNLKTLENHLGSSPGVWESLQALGLPASAVQHKPWSYPPELMAYDNITSFCYAI